MTRSVKQWAESSCQGRLVSCLEAATTSKHSGGTVRAHVRELANLQ